MKNTLPRLLFAIAISMSGCSLASGIYKAGAWTGIIGAIALLAVIIALILTFSSYRS